MSDTQSNEPQEVSNRASDGTGDKVDKADKVDKTLARKEAEAARQEAIAAAAQERTEAQEKNLSNLIANAKDTPLSLARFDWASIQAYFQPLNVLLYLFAAGFLAFTTGSALLGAVTSLLLWTLYMSYPFAVDSKYHTRDALQSSGISSSSIYAGRLLFAFAFSLCAGSVSMLSAYIGTQFSSSELLIFPNLGIIEGFVFMMLAYWAIMLIQILLYFVFDISKIRFVGFLPLLLAIVVFGSQLI
jgi:hypothetical protein